MNGTSKQINGTNLRLKFSAADAGSDGSYKSAIKDVSFTNPQFKEKDGLYQRQAIKEISNIMLEVAAKEEDRTDDKLNFILG